MSKLIAANVVVKNSRSPFLVSFCGVFVSESEVSGDQEVMEFCFDSHNLG